MSIIVTTLEELGEDGVPTPLLDAILENLLKQNEKPASYHLAQQVLAHISMLAMTAGSRRTRPNQPWARRSHRKASRIQCRVRPTRHLHRTIKRRTSRPGIR